MYHYYYPEVATQNEEVIDSGTKGGVLKKMWGVLPLKVTSIIGSQIFRYL